MRIAVDFDGTIVVQDGRDYTDTTTPLEYMPGAEVGLRSLKRAGHVLLLWSGRASRALLVDPTLDPLVRAGVVRVNLEQWRRSQVINRARHEQMLQFVRHNLLDVFDAIDDGAAGKPSVDLFIDDKALQLGGEAGTTWRRIAAEFGDPE